MIGAFALRALVGAGLSAQQILAVVEAIEADARPKDRNAAERQARRRERLRAAEEGAGDGLFPETGNNVAIEAAPASKVAVGVARGDAESVTPGVTKTVTGGVTTSVTPRVTGGVTSAVTAGVTSGPSPLDENISNPPGSTLTPDGVSPLPPRRAARAGRLPDDFVMPDEWKSWARTQRSWATETVATEAENFADYWQARATGATKRDWRKAWQNWVRNSNRPDGTHREAKAQSPDERKQAAEEHAARLERIGRAEDAELVRRRWATGPPHAGANGAGSAGSTNGNTFRNGRR